MTWSRFVTRDSWLNQIYIYYTITYFNLNRHRLSDSWITQMQLYINYSDYYTFKKFKMRTLLCYEIKYYYN